MSVIDTNRNLFERYRDMIVLQERSIKWIIFYELSWLYCAKETLSHIYICIVSKSKRIGGVSVCLLAVQEEERGKKVEHVSIRILDIINQTINRDFIVSIIMFDEIFDITVYTNVWNYNINFTREQLRL